MKIFKAMAVYFENRRLKKRIDELELLLRVTEKSLLERRNAYRNLLGEREIQKQKMDFLDLSLTNANKIIEEIVKVATENGYGNNKNKLQKIIELAKNQTQNKSY